MHSINTYRYSIEDDMMICVQQQTVRGGAWGRTVGNTNKRSLLARLPPHLFHLQTHCLVINSVSACIRGQAMLFRGPACVLIIMSLFEEIHCHFFSCVCTLDRYRLDTQHKCTQVEHRRSFDDLCVAANRPRWCLGFRRWGIQTKGHCLLGCRRICSICRPIVLLLIVSPLVYAARLCSLGGLVVF